jgi:ankyrin repeat protein
VAWCELLLELGAAATSANADGYSVLQAAAGNGQVDTAKLLLARGADPNTADGQGYSPLHEAVLAKSEELVRMLLEAGADKTAQVSGSWDVVKPGMTAKDIAEAKSLDAIVALLS